VSTVDVGAPAPEVYRLSMEKLPLATGRARRFAFVQALAGVTVFVAALTLALRNSSAAIDAALGVWGLAVIAIPYVSWRAGLRVRRRWNAFELSIGGTNMRCAARGSGRVTMPLDDIASITEGANGLVVRSSLPGVVIRIPTVVEGFLDVRARLAVRRAITIRADALLWCGALLVTGLVGAATAGVWGRSGCVSLGVLSTQAAAAITAGVEIRWHTRLSRARKIPALVAVGVAAVLPVLGLVASALLG
jgi:hypothetical protein